MVPKRKRCPTCQGYQSKATAINLAADGGPMPYGPAGQPLAPPLVYDSCPADCTGQTLRDLRGGPRW